MANLDSDSGMQGLLEGEGVEGFSRLACPGQTQLVISGWGREGVI